MKTRQNGKPNIVLILMDDMGYGDPGCYGNRVIRTPAMDRIADEGVRFTQMYAAAPTCSPSRCGLLTGRYPQKVGIPRVLFPDDTIGLGPADRTIADCLGTCGYRSACIGKWHLGCLPEHYPTRHGFDYFYGLLYSNDMEPLHLYENEKVLLQEVDQAALTEAYTAAAIRFISDCAAREEPFFCYVAHTMPHIPLHVPERFRGISAGGTYGDTIECIDYYIGTMMDTLGELGIEEETLFIVTSDNGPWFEGSTGGLRGRKFEVYEGGIRMPFIARWKSVIPAGTQCDEAASLMDMLPTAANLAGGNAAQLNSLDGRDIFPLMRGEGSSPHEALYFYTVDELNAVRSGRWKLHTGTGRGAARKTAEMPQLFDLHTDPGENYNLADRRPDVVRRLTGMMEAFDRSVQPIGNAARNNK